MIVKDNERKEEVLEQLRGGNGASIFSMIHPRKAIKNVNLFTVATLKPGCSIGFHQHIEETEYYHILEGKGLVKENSGETVVEKGDTIITTDKESHAIENIGDEDLKFLAVIISF